ncbi:MAG TPA: flagellar basal body P-ring protein FlgI [Opitutaceae bacterium]|nr:flagellar basal body P-ring protein FlgI [Opitutaceae bacterium]
MSHIPFARLLGTRLRHVALALLALGAGAGALPASRIKDITLIEGDRDNQLVGYGLVVGLAGAGDSNPNATLHSVANVMQRYGITVNPQQDVTAKNTAAVMVTADISAFLKSGARIDVTVASLGDAKALQGGVLLQTPLLGGDGHTYAVAQGPVAIGGFLGGQGGAGGATVQKNHPTVGTINNGAIVEREIPAQFVHNGSMRLLLHNPDFTSASRMADAINGLWPAAASALDAATVQVHLPPRYAGREVPFISDLGMIEVIPDTLARVVINERTGTIVATSTVRISEVAIADGSLTITVSSNTGVSQPLPFSTGGTTTPVQSTQTTATETKGSLIVLSDLPTIQQLAAALNSLGVSTREMMAIFQTLKRAGALQADLVIN